MEINKRVDAPLVTLRFYTALAERLTEVSRLQTSVDHVKAIIDVLARVVDHYPERPK